MMNPTASRASVMRANVLSHPNGRKISMLHPFFVFRLGQPPDLSFEGSASRFEVLEHVEACAGRRQEDYLSWVSRFISQPDCALEVGYFFHGGGFSQGMFYFFSGLSKEDDFFDFLPDRLPQAREIRPFIPSSEDENNPLVEALDSLDRCIHCCRLRIVDELDTAQAGDFLQAMLEPGEPPNGAPHHSWRDTEDVPDEARSHDIFQVVAPRKGNFSDGHDPAFFIVPEDNGLAVDKAAALGFVPEAERINLSSCFFAQGPDPRIIAVEDGQFALSLAKDEFFLGRKIILKSAMPIEMILGDVEEDGDRNAKAVNVFKLEA